MVFPIRKFKVLRRPGCHEAFWPEGNLTDSLCEHDGQNDPTPTVTGFHFPSDFRASENARKGGANLVIAAPGESGRALRTPKAQSSATCL